MPTHQLNSTAEGTGLARGNRSRRGSLAEVKA